MNETPADDGRWWAVDEDEAPDGEGARFAKAMDELVADHKEGEGFLPAFLSWLQREALDPEMYGEWLRADPDALAPLADAFDAGWLARNGERAGYA